MKSFVSFVNRVCFIGSKKCNQGGRLQPEQEIFNGVVNNGILITNMGIVVVHNGS